MNYSMTINKFLLLLAVVLLASFTVASIEAQTNSTTTNSTSTNSTGTFEGIIEEIVIEEPIQDPDAPQLVLTTSVFNQGAMLVITGSGLPQNSSVETTIYHPDNSKFAIYKSTTTNAGEFQTFVEIYHTSIQGEYRIESISKAITLTKTFVYSGGNDLSFAEITTVLDETPEIADSTTETPPISSTTTSTSTSSSTSTTVTNDWVLFLEHLDPLDRLDLIRAVFSYLLS